MALSRSARIIILLVIDTLFFLLEIIVGYAVHSLALVADSFHMLNDAISLLVALWAIKLSKQTSSSSYTYGWQRAEVLGALINGVFLVALCLSIFLEALERFVRPQIITNPLMVLYVGSAGLASNLVGLYLFHDSHASPQAPVRPLDEEIGHKKSSEERPKRLPDDIFERLPLDENGSISELLPETVVARTISARSQLAEQAHQRAASRSPTLRSSDHATSGSRPRKFADPEANIHVLPAQNRLEIINAAESGSDEEAALDPSPSETPTEATPLHGLDDTSSKKRRSYSVSHEDHIHSRPKDSKKSGQKGNLNMRGVFLHVLGDALGNIGVILTALFIWKTDYSWRFYFDPVISLIITIIILSSALPLCKSASKILLQAVPKGISLDEVKQDITSIPGILSVHELHIWQLSDIKMIASVHIQIGFDPEMVEDGPEGRRAIGYRYMKLAKAVRRCLHGYGIHSSTIQPEYNGATVGAAALGAYNNSHAKAPLKGGPSTVVGSSAAAPKESPPSDKDACLLDCGDECEDGKCCGPVVVGKGTEHGHTH